MILYLSQGSVLSPLIWLLIPIIGGVATILMVVVYDVGGQYVWMPWVLPNVSFIQPLNWYYWSKRTKGMKNVIQKWNR